MNWRAGCLLMVVSGAFAAGPPPKTTISNGQVRAVICLPNAENGCYRGARFDWAGVIETLEYGGHTFFGRWSPETNPTVHDAISGPVEEFRSEDGALGFGKAQPKDLFVKIGVGLLRKPDDRPYQFARDYEIAGHGVWIARPGPDRVEFVQELRNSDGYQYIYKKTIRLARNNPELILEHSLKNTGKQTMETSVYDHDFFVLDAKPTGPATKVTFTFDPKAAEGLGKAGRIEGKQIRYERELKPEHDTVAGYLTGYGDSKQDNDVRVENNDAGIGVRQTGDFPISKLYFWSVRTTVCPEIYHAMSIPPGKTAKWRIKYDFYKLPKNTEVVTKGK